MDVLEAIHTRQSIGAVRADPVPRELIEKLLEAAVQAPNHYKVRPWRFVVVAGAARERLGEVFAQALAGRSAHLSEEALAAAMSVERAKPLRAPVVIVVGVDPPSQPKVIEVENICAAAAATQNLLLAAHALGLAAKWRTGAPAVDPEVKAHLGFAPDQHLIAFIYLGYPQMEAAPAARLSAEDRTTWLE